MRVKQFRDAAEFCAIAEPLLIQNEAENNLMLGLAGTYRLEPPAPEHFWAVVLDGELPIQASMMTPPNSLILSRGPDEATGVLVDHVVDSVEIPAVSGPVETAQRASELFARRLSSSVKPHCAMRIFQNERVIPPRPASGVARVADERDWPLVLGWIREFEIECGLRVPINPERLLARVKKGLYRLWLDPEPVSIAVATGPTPNGIRIGAVYTPPQFRGRGYASNCVAALTQDQLDQGRKFCFLYTDLSNPTSNKIYQQIGYTPVCDWMDYTLG